ncbi:GFA family protein [Limibaculum sp. M0105]|uniref:GFA family protein n=1 Tax=Thermohalobaculum xanthum TaxID=2753746 RepID=A0A8J7M7B1_9RHOB|nr:GFA family protein [Thermohalobaculum xanthum]MBK0399187.1 GFA family protein [Thermohalobaculum xanthum]
MTSEDAIHRGGCLCGACRFEARGAPTDTGYCHCRMCQRSSGAPAQTFALYPEDRFRYVAGTPSVYRSSDWGVREFCPVCGSQLAFRDADGVSLNTGCLDAPETMPPRRHIYCDSRIAWFDTADDLPRE